MGGHLVTIGSDQENAFVTALKTGPTWLGLTDESSEGTWVWITGEPLSYTAWLGGEPNNANGGENHAIMESSGGWNDVPNVQAPFIVEWDSADPIDIITPTANQQFNKHESQVEKGSIGFTWKGTNVIQYSVSLFDKDAHRYIKNNENVNAQTSLNISTQRFKYGHQYVFTLNAKLNDGTQASDKVTFEINVLPEITDPDTQALDQGSLMRDKATKRLRDAMDRFDTATRKRGWKVTYTSIYRTIYYQEHLYLIMNNLNDTSLSDEKRAILTNEQTSHGLKYITSPPSPNSPHVKGIAFDAVVTDSKGKQLNGKANGVKVPLDPRLKNLAESKQVGLRMPFPVTDSVHFQL